MKLVKPDHETRYEVPGVPGLVRKPVNLDGAELGFTKLRSLRLYQFEAGTVINGHAEQDEVFVIVTAGSVEMKIGYSDEAVDRFGTFTLSAPGFANEDDPFVAYLPPHSVYRMTPHTDADVFYARATPSEVREPAVFRANTPGSPGPVNTLFGDNSHAERLRLKVLSVAPSGADVTLQMVNPADVACEVVVHVQGTPAAKVATLQDSKANALNLASWDTVALSPREHPVLTVEQGGAVTIVAVLAC
ncbi:5-deoxy-glucuronate isomerase [Terriglobus sp.]|uniref:5-deoxy-glucuronate isomerase n=1 Tax=Terriglobus sp. TaxID=1889013 RepID=UPI003B008CED